MDFTKLVNKTNLLDETYVPNNLIETDQNENNFHNYADPTLKPQVQKYVFEQFQKLQHEAAKDNLFIIIDSGYRSYEYQKKVYEKICKEKGLEYAKQFVAPPGASEHQTGIAIDIAAIRNNNYSDEIEENDKEVLWMMDHSYKYGFILRYPKGKENITGYSFEPWHFRYVGISLATFIHQNNLTLEEYYLKKNEYDSIDIANLKQNSKTK